MNVEKLQKLADHIRGLGPGQFDLKHWSLDKNGDLVYPSFPKMHCGCIGGWASALSDVATFTEARKELGIDTSVAGSLFFPRDEGSEHGWPQKYRRDNEKAAEVIERLIRTGQVNWDA